MEIKTHLTAISRKCASKPLRLLLKKTDIIEKNDRILDYGCGKGTDIEYLRRLGCRAEGYDPYEPFGFSDPPEGKFNTVLMTYVLNVIPYERERNEALESALNYVTDGGWLFIATRTKKAIKGVRY